MKPKEKPLPDAAGWWARNQDGRVQWFEIEFLSSDDDPSPFPRLYPLIFVAEVDDYLPLASFTRMRCRWFGPVTLPWKE